MNARKYRSVYLNGCIHTDDRIALKSIMEQLDVHITDFKTRTFSDLLNWFLEILNQEGEYLNSALIVIIDEFDEFCKHGNQTLLYNLFDIAQSKRHPICVIGVSTSIDTIELLEKRVKSRFSHRHILFGGIDNIEDFVQATVNALTIKGQVQMNEEVELLFNQRSVQRVCEYFFETSKDLRQVFSHFIPAVMKMDTKLELDHIQSEFELHKTDCNSLSLQGITILQLSLLIAIKRLIDKDIKPINFEVIYHEYSKLLVSEDFDSIQAFPKKIAFRAFDDLIALNILEFSERTKKLLRNYRPVYCQLTSMEIAQTVLTYPECPTSLRKWGRQ